MTGLPAVPSDAPQLGWLGMMRLGLVQTALGAIFVLSTSTLNRVMTIELNLSAVLPGALIGLHYAMQLLRPRLGHGSDVGGRRTPWIIGGMAVLALGGVAAAAATALMRTSLTAGIALAIPAFVAIGLGVSAAGTALLVLIAGRTAPERRPAAATIAWVMMIIGFVVTAGVAGKLLDPFSPARLVAVAAAISAVGFLVACLAVRGMEPVSVAPPPQPHAFGLALREVWAEPRARRFAIFVFVSMLAYGGEDLLIEPFAGALFAMTPGQTAKLSGMLHGGALLGMILVAVTATALRRHRVGALRLWMVGGCVVSAAALLVLAGLGIAGMPGSLVATLFVLGAANGAYAIAAIGAMMQLVGADGPDKQGVRMGLWGAAQACAFGAGGLAATALSDLAYRLVAWRPGAYAGVFVVEAAVFLAAAMLAARLEAERRALRPLGSPVPAARPSR